MYLQSDRQLNNTYFILLATLIVVFSISVCMGAVDVSVEQIVSAISKTIQRRPLDIEERIIIQIRLPRTILCTFTGASLAIGGILMQALFRNPIVEPGLVGTSSGAAFGAGLYFVLGNQLKNVLGLWALPVLAFFGGAVATYAVFVLAAKKKENGNAGLSLLLTGIAVNALFMSALGFLSYVARDPQARSITFWTMGTFSGAGWESVSVVAPVTIASLALSLRHVKELNALLLGENEAFLLGVNLHALRRVILTINVIAVATCTAFVGVIGFVGLIVPHILRMWRGADNRYLLKSGVLLGAILVCMSDLLARMALRPAELPIGIITSITGAPLLIYLLRSRKDNFSR